MRYFVSKPSRLLAGILVFLGGCSGPDPDGAIVFLDPDYSPSLVADETDGITSPDGLLWHDGQLYIADEGGSAVRMMTASGQIVDLATAEAGIASPEDLAIDADGRILFTDDTAGGVWGISDRGNAERIVRDGELGPTEGITLTANGSVLAGDTDHQRVAEIREGETPSSFGPGPLPAGKYESLAFDSAGRLYVADNERDVLFRVLTDGRPEVLIADQEDFSPETIALISDELFITDSHNGKLYRYRPGEDIEVIAIFAGDFANINGITGDTDGNLFVSVQADLAAGRGYIIRLDRQPQSER